MSALVGHNIKHCPGFFQNVIFNNWGTDCLVFLDAVLEINNACSPGRRTGIELLYRSESTKGLEKGVVCIFEFLHKTAIIFIGLIEFGIPVIHHITISE